MWEMTPILKNLVKNILRQLGIVVHKKQRWYNNYRWITDRQIRTVIDIGANTGQFVLFIKDIVPDATVYAFEPVSEVFEKLKKNITDPKVFLYQYALGAENTEADINVNTFNPSSSLLELANSHIANYEFARKSHTERIQVRRADDVLREVLLDNDILVKIDVQGYEDKVLKGAREVLAKAKIVICEICYEELYKNQELFHTLYTTLSEMGYRYAGNLEQYYNNETGIPLYADGIFIKEDNDRNE